MTTRIEDFLSGIKTHLVESVSGLTADMIVIGYPDDRIVADANVGRIRVAISAHLESDPDNATSGRQYIVTKDLDANTAELKHPPLPFRIVVDVHTFSRTHPDDWAIEQAMVRLFASGKSIATPAGETYYPRYDGSDDQTDLTARGFARVYRFSVPIWLDDARAAETVSLVLQTIFTINGEQVAVSSED